ncbi:hypothetical protein QBC34DRAFT_224391 [Podospora aff. communis PSN243]|uniref:Transmembrane protein n=1 Tax=Podospora aff. communis PSN243 TaxID=3040156 RepID=A0AAV9G5I3_9PEZI|nr:hypothetical protein QBC34DRAFT_224391 [Podospora aff. communis PSN243]
MSTCEPIQGNPDLYGIGIRIGVYLQWASAWVTFLIDAKSAQSILDTNSAFVFAVTIATIIASRRDTGHIELYIMLQILLGFFVTTLSSFGVRIWLMTPSRAEKLIKKAHEELSNYGRKKKEERMELKRAVKEARERARERRAREKRAKEKRVEKGSANTRLPLARNLGIVASESSKLHWLLARILVSLAHLSTLFSESLTSSSTSQVPSAAASVAALPVNLFSALKFPELTWSGVVWRTTTLGLISVYNIMYWEEVSTGESNDPGNCEAPVVFLFSKQLLLGSVVQLGRAIAIIMIVLVGPPIYTLIWLTVKIHYFGILLLIRDIFHSRQAPELVGAALSRINKILHQGPLPVMEAFHNYSALFPSGMVAVVALKSSLDFLDFVSTKPTGDAARFTDLLKVFVSLGMGKPSIQQAPEVGPALSRADTMLRRKALHPESSYWRVLSLLCNVYTVLSIVWFILSIELTIRWNKIQGVNALDSTGQLIPFIIGCVSASQTVKKLILVVLAKIYPDWVDVELKVDIGPEGPTVLGIVKHAEGDDVEATASPAGTRGKEQGPSLTKQTPSAQEDGLLSGYLAYSTTSISEG